MRATAELADRLTELLELAYPPVAVTFCKDPPSCGTEAVVMQPAGCCYWEPAQKGRLTTKPSDHSNCSVGSFTHGLIDLEVAAAADDTEPLADVNQPDVVLVRLSPYALMTLQGACPQIRLVTKPQCQIVPLANAGEIVVSPGCAVSRARTNIPAGELTCAFHGTALRELVERLERSTAVDHAVAAYAVANDRQHFVALP
jgi:uncharacterized protein (DUF169 family)